MHHLVAEVLDNSMDEAVAGYANRIDVELHADYSITIRDNGRGIPKDQQDLIFEKFSRAGDQKAGGAGLGLAICKEIMQRLGGDISYLPGQGGAGFRVLLPLDDGGSAKRV